MMRGIIREWSWGYTFSLVFGALTTVGGIAVAVLDPKLDGAGRFLAVALGSSFLIGAILAILYDRPTSWEDKPNEGR